MNIIFVGLSFQKSQISSIHILCTKNFILNFSYQAENLTRQNKNNLTRFLDLLIITSFSLILLKVIKKHEARTLNNSKIMDEISNLVCLSI